MNLFEYYEKLPDSISPKTIFVEETAKKCGVRTDSVRNWIKGRTRPSDKMHYKILSEVTGIPVNQLFPRSNDNID